MHLTSPFKKRGMGGGEKGRKGKPQQFVLVKTSPGGLAATQRNHLCSFPTPCTPLCFIGGELPPPAPTPTLGRAAAAGAALRAGRAGVPGGGGRCTGGDRQPSCPDLAPPLPPTGNFPKCHRITLVILFQGFFKFCRWGGEEKREGGGLGGAGWEGMALECRSASAAGLLGGGSGPARRQGGLRVAGTLRQVPALGTRPSPGCCAPPHGRALGSCSAVTQGMPSGWRRDMSPHLLLTAFMHLTVSQGGEEEILAHQGGGSPWLWLG